MVHVANSLASFKSISRNNRYMPMCWSQKENCIQKVFIDGHVVFYTDYRRKLQYTPTFNIVGMVYGVQPGKMFMPLHVSRTKLSLRN